MDGGAKSIINKTDITFISPLFPSPSQISLIISSDFGAKLDLSRRNTQRINSMALFSYFSSNDRSTEWSNSKRIDYSGEEFKDAEAGSALSSIADAFEEISDLIINGKNGDFVVLKLKPFCDACSFVSVLFGCLGIAFKFAEMEYTSKVRDLDKASERYVTLSTIVDYDVKWNTVKSHGSLTRNLRRVRQGLDLIRELFQNFLATNDYSLKDAASSAYQKACAPYHTWAVRAAVSAGMCALPSREQLLLNLNESEQSAEVQMRRFIKASLPLIKYIDNLYLSRGITLDW